MPLRYPLRRSLLPSQQPSFESSYFSRNGPEAKLPSPANVRGQNAMQDPGAIHGDYGYKPVRYENLGLIVKFGRAPEVTLAEGQGITLEQRWKYLGRAERVAICEQLRDIIFDFRWVQHAPDDFFLGHNNREPLGDIIFTKAIKTRIRPLWLGKELSEIPDPYRSRLPDDAKVVFTHSDLHPSNIMVSADSNKIIAVIDWRQSG
ncbi:phosphotransferase enzyme family protein [Nannizzia gypsea CBS 118893]|uniref:Phosphotransferase enzyme family protein n=1 Tax=Arthroderma gypseum (strain ATCC MYA-4604 / CBS 118893) TaxID=535722 RepID=E4V1L9_ARTGP|nr:phosphotransferase enzyme family protein [Nannizzia gypsea CBS 118893]EFR03934.1 phosphotransferase enzyme family protein [Nannizzia gypsea CBS 118893]